VWRDVVGPEPENVPNYSRDWSEPQGQELLWKAAMRHFLSKDIQDQAPGDVLLFRMRDRGIAKHLGIAANIGEFPTFIHAYSGHAVVESALSLPWRRRIVARFSFPEGEV
jgi:NlpC/P60 family putative phage cell wall peptidase